MRQCIIIAWKPGSATAWICEGPNRRVPVENLETLPNTLQTGQSWPCLCLVHRS